MVRQLQRITIPLTLLILAFTCLSTLLAVESYYKKTNIQLRNQIQVRLPLDYISAEVKSLKNGTVKLQKYDDTDVLVLRELGSSTEECLYIYNGYLYKLEKKTYEELELGAGEVLMIAANLEIEIVDNQMLIIRGKINNQTDIEHIVSLKKK